MERRIREDERVTDDWGCEWLSVQPGILGQCVGHPFGDGWDGIDEFPVPDPVTQIDWESEKRGIEECKERGVTAYGFAGGIYEGGFFDRLQFLRGLENLLCDMQIGSSGLDRAIERILEYNLKAINKSVTLDPDVICFHGDIGSQNGLMFSPELFRRYLKPGYKRMFTACREAGAHVWYSSDGNLLEIVDDLIECGISLHDPQLRPNTLEGIVGAYRGKVCAMVDLDQQMLPFCTPADIIEQMEQVMDAMYSDEGGLMLFTSPSADVPFENVEALCRGWKSLCR